ncbi:hypothetical protein FY557_17940 [Chryseobacterium sp. SN22]|uniref:hypothetical protein n=1 Tax=Chryseobacterium sp. SN22 TaxID=2606431 RepID=UPI0011EBFFE8|nr:hypothetical protein [Chryseobacterium sp. SN22]KAA0126314.1 hypothetical protein FY557_17940 [Chryseobacterium sp. SN22]
MKLSEEQYIIIQTTAVNYFKNIGGIRDIKIYNSAEFLDIVVYPESSLILNSNDIEKFSETLKEIIFQLKDNSELMIVEFDVINRCISFSVSF